VVRCIDICQVLRALREIEFEGVITADHIPMMADDHRVGTAFSIGHVRAILEWASADVGGD
jgi:mannonate dehydratase